MAAIPWIHQIETSFGGVDALAGVSFELRPAEVHRRVACSRR
ncbi:hypothetical protein WME90_20895 [Sorangium sp. So ce375]